ncbi:MAG TPA: A24 family peptidase [Chloroflexota bacterium]
MDNILNGILVLAAVWAVVTDLRHRRISNRTTLAAALAAGAVRLAMGGPASLLVGAEGWLLGVAVLLLPFVMGWMGAGDVKLLAAFGALRGPEFVIQTAILGCLLGGVLSLAYLAREGKLGFTLRHLVIFIRHPLGGAMQATRRMPFGPALAAGAAASLILAARPL